MTDFKQTKAHPDLRGAALGAADLKDEPPARPPDRAARASPGTAADAMSMDAASVAAARPAC